VPGRDEVVAMMHGYGYGGPGLFLFMGLLSFLILVAGVMLIVGIAMRASRRGTGWGHGPGRHPGAPAAGWGAAGFGGAATVAAGPSAAALGILEERLARGEIDIETYRSLRAELTRTDPAPS
jgi:uncharacterized membrane protein